MRINIGTLKWLAIFVHKRLEFEQRTANRADKQRCISADTRASCARQVTSDTTQCVPRTAQYRQLHMVYRANEARTK